MPDVEEVGVVVRVPLSQIETELREKHAITLPRIGVSLEGEQVVFHFGSPSALAGIGAPRDSRSPSATRQPFPAEFSVEGDSDLRTPRPRKRRKARRNRMKTRGWGIAAKMTNSKGQTVTIYEPFVEALKDKSLTRREREAAVTRILRDNGNRPGPVSVDYYLSNTLEYLAKGAEA